MAARAALLLHRGWHRGARRWWLASAGSIALVLVMMLTVLGTFEGMDQATQDRVAAFYTGDLRITASPPSAAPFAALPNGTEDPVPGLADAAGPGGRLSVRLEAQFVLSRRSLVEAYLEEDEQYTLGTPGTVPEDELFYGIGILVGIDAREARTADGLRPYLVAGALPDSDGGDGGEVQLLMSAKQFRRHLSSEERAAISAWPPSTAELRAIRFEITSAVVDASGAFKDIIRLPARAVGLFDTRLDALDTFTMVAPIQDVRRLTNHGPEDDVANVIVLEGGDAGAARRQAHATGLRTETSQGFSERYVGQLVRVLQVLSLVLTGFFFLLPLFLVTHGISQQLQMHQREVAVCQAIGVSRRTLSGAMFLLAGRTLLAGLLATAAAMSLLAAVLRRALPAWSDLPMPMEFRLDPVQVLLVAAAAVLSTLAGLAFTLRRSRRRDLASALRTF